MDGAGVQDMWVIGIGIDFFALSLNFGRFDRYFLFIFAQYQKLQYISA